MKGVDRSELAVVSLATLLGLAIRLAAVSPAALPLNDGGLFYAMIRDLASNGLGLPAFTTYNAASIPFAYPPVAFYFYAMLSIATHAPLLQLMQYGPAVVSCASIPAFYLLARDLLRERAQAAIATLIFCLLPRAFDWLIMGGGVTRSFGMLFALLAMRQAFVLFSARSRRAILPLIVFGSLVVFSHPEASVHTAVSAALFYLWKDRSRNGFLNGAIAAAGVLALTLPWWASVLGAHGLDPFLAASAAAREDSYNPLIGIFVFFRLDFALEPFVSILTVLGVVGMFSTMARRQFLLPVWLVVMHALEPRGGTLFMMIPLALCAGIGLDQVILPGLAAGSLRSAPPMDSGQNWFEHQLAGRWTRIFVGFVLIYAIVAAFVTGLRIQQQLTLSAPDLEAFTWVRDHTGPHSRFALVTGGLPLLDASSDWFPALTGRQSIATVFGFEWIRSEDFAQRIARYRSLQVCANETADCLRTWSQQQAADYDYIYIRNSDGVGAVPLVSRLAESTDYRDVFASKTVVIYQHK